MTVVALWFRRNVAGRRAQHDPDDEPTGTIPAADLAKIVEEADRQAGTESGADTSETAVESVTASSEHVAVDPDQVSAERRALIQLCMYAMDRARSGGVAERLEQGLAEIGVRALRPDGDRFDPGVHEAGGAVPTEDGALVGTVAETEAVGFADRDQLLRAPVVTVYTER